MENKNSRLALIDQIAITILKSIQNVLTIEEVNHNQNGAINVHDIVLSMVSVQLQAMKAMINCNSDYNYTAALMSFQTELQKITSDFNQKDKNNEAIN